MASQAKPPLLCSHCVQITKTPLMSPLSEPPSSFSFSQQRREQLSRIYRFCPNFRLSVKMTRKPLAVLTQATAIRGSYDLREGQKRHFHRLPSGLKMEVIEQEPPAHVASTWKDAPPVVLVHGSFHAAWCWAEHWMPFFSSSGLHCYAISLLGQGESDVPQGAASGTLEHPKHTIIFVYGTLKRDFPNYNLLSGFIHSGDVSLLSPSAATTTPYPLVVGPTAVPVPFLLPLPSAAGSHVVSGELVSVSPCALTALDSFEGVPLGCYERCPVVVKTEDGVELEAEAYFAHRSYADVMWRRSGEKGFAEYTQEMAREYIKPEDRPLGIQTLGEIIQTFLG